jgi:hypothetical protein
MNRRLKRFIIGTSAKCGQKMRIKRCKATQWRNLLQAV